MPKLVRLYIRECLIGFGLAAVFTAMLIGLDVAGLRHLVLSSSMGWLAAFMLFFAHGIVFAGVQFGMTIMRMAEDDEDDPFGGHRQRRTPVAEPVPAPVRAEAPRVRER